MVAMQPIWTYSAVFIAFLYAIRDTMTFAVLRAVFELLVMLLKVKVHGFLIQGRVWSLADLIESRVDKNPYTVQIITAEDGDVTTLGMIDMDANRIANWGKDELKLQQKNTVCLMMHNKPGFVSFWYGMLKIGVSTAMLNTNTTGKSFLHSVRVSVAMSDHKVVVIDDELRGTLSSEIEELEREGVNVISWSSLLSSVALFSSTRPPRSCRSLVKEDDPALFIFTSGTTGAV